MIKRILLPVLTITALFLAGGNIQPVSVQANDREVVVAQLAEDEGSFVQDNDAASFTSHKADEDLLHVTTGFDLNEAIKAIESGELEALSLENRPEIVNEESILEFEAHGEKEQVLLDSVSVQSNCAHVYQQGVFTVHKKNDDGSCDSASYDALRCNKCNKIWLIELISTSHLRVCTH